MAKKWNAEDTALIQKELQNPTMTNQELADKLGRSLQSIAAKKRSVEEKLVKKGGWTPEEDSKLLAIPFKSEDDLARELHRDKKDVHARREHLNKKRMAEKERKAKEMQQVEKSKRVPLESYTAKLDVTELLENAEKAEITEIDALPEEMLTDVEADISALKQKLSAIKAAVSMLRVQNSNKLEQALDDFQVLADYILSDI
ncbi:MAG: hypothetical protein IJM46_05870 [Oscillospiraceae bacterium]|nr:hypothetical protein [Oscillospiraceae bacterium]